MTTYTLGATDLITLINSTVTNPTGLAIFESLESAFHTAFPFSTTTVQQTNGPANSTPSGYTVPTTDTIAAGIQLELLTLPTSTSIIGAGYPLPVSGTETSSPVITLTSFGDVLIAAGDQVVTLRDKNTGLTSDTLLGGASSETLVSLSGNNLLIAGTGLGNTLKGGTGADTLLGSGNSKLEAGTGANVLMSSTLGSGHDVLTAAFSGGGSALLVAQAGNNRLVGGTGHDTLVGGPGGDTLVGGGTSDMLLGSGANKVRESVNGAHDTIVAGAGSDTVAFNFGLTGVADSIVGGTGALKVADLSGANTINTGAGFANIWLTSVEGGNLENNISNQTITSGSGGLRIVTDESASNYAATQVGGVYTVKFSDTGQTLTVNDATGNSVKIVFGDNTHVTI